MHEGPQLQVTYTHLSGNDTYTDQQGNKHVISKIVRTFSDVDDSNLNYVLQHGSSFTYDPDHIFSIAVCKDPVDGVNLVDDIKIHDDYYDQNGQKINIQGNAYITASSLNHGYGDPNHLEKATGNKIYTLIGSTVTAHSDGWLYSDKNNDFKEYGGSWDPSQHNGKGWDGNREYEYYGAGVIDAADNGGISIRFHADHTQTYGDDWGMWGQMSTIIPATPFNEKKPEPKYSSIHYHYDVAQTTF